MACWVWFGLLGLVEHMSEPGDMDVAAALVACPVLVGGVCEACRVRVRVRPMERVGERVRERATERVRVRPMEVQITVSD